MKHTTGIGRNVILPRARQALFAVPLAILFASCGPRSGCGAKESDPAQAATWDARRMDMVQHLRTYGVTNATVLAAMGKIRRHLFIPEDYRHRQTAYGDNPGPIGYEQTISQPYIVAYMTECMDVRPGDKVLEIGTGSGYQAAVLAECGADVYTIEIIPELARHAESVLLAEGYADRVHVLAGDGYKGWQEHMPYDNIIVTCAPEEIPRALVEQLKEGGRMILPLGESGHQRLVVLTRHGDQVEVKYDLLVRFVPMVHGHEP